MARNTKALRYSYKNKQVCDARFFEKDFNKTESYNSDFSGSIFRNTSFVGAKFKFCTLNNTRFTGCLIQGTMFRKCQLQNVTFEKCIITSVNRDRTSFKDVTFSNSILISTNLDDCKNIVSCEIRKEYPSERDFNQDLISQIQSLRKNTYINKSGVLHRKQNKINTAALKILLIDFDEEFLIKNLYKLNDISKGFYTLSYLTTALKKTQASVIISTTRPTTA